MDTNTYKNTNKGFKVLITMPIQYQKAFISKEAEEKLSSFAEVIKNDTIYPLSELEISEILKEGVDGVVVGWGDKGLTEENLEKGTKLKIIGIIGSSVKKVCPEKALQKGIVIVNGAEIIGNLTAEHTVALILCLSRKICDFSVGMKKGDFASDSWDDIEETLKWPPLLYLWDKEVGIIGLGIVGKRVAELLRPFRPSCIKAYSPNCPILEAEELGIKIVSLEDAIRNSDIISIHTGLRSDTFGMIGKRELDLMKEGAILVNTARGRIIDEEALVSKLEEGKIWAALDVFSEEPLPEKSPLRSLKNVILTPHIGGPHIGSCEERIRRKLGVSIIQDFERFFSGESPINSLSRERIQHMT